MDSCEPKGFKMELGPVTVLFISCDTHRHASVMLEIEGKRTRPHMMNAEQAQRMVTWAAHVVSYEASPHVN